MFYFYDYSCITDYVINTVLWLCSEEFSSFAYLAFTPECVTGGNWLKVVSNTLETDPCVEYAVVDWIMGIIYLERLSSTLKRHVTREPMNRCNLTTFCHTQLYLSLSIKRLFWGETHSGARWRKFEKRWRWTFQPERDGLRTAVCSSRPPSSRGEVSRLRWRVCTALPPRYNGMAVGIILWTSVRQTFRWWIRLVYVMNQVSCNGGIKGFKEGCQVLFPFLYPEPTTIVVSGACMWSSTRLDVQLGSCFDMLTKEKPKHQE